MYADVLLSLLSALGVACVTVGPETDTADEAGVPAQHSAPLCESTSPGALFDKRIAPILAEDRPKSCSQCHLAGIDLSDFVRDTACETMACLDARGLIDFSAPKESLLLSWIRRAEPQSELITEAVIQEEYDGFLAWIDYGAQCFDAHCADVTCGPRAQEAFCDVEPEPFEVLSEEADRGGCSDLALEDLFRKTVYDSRQRCFPCHFESETNADERAPRWIVQSGNCDASSLATMRGIVDAGYVDMDEPENSLLLLKPLAEENGGVEHIGHDKFASLTDPAYLNFRLWIERYAACAR